MTEPEAAAGEPASGASSPGRFSRPVGVRRGQAPLQIAVIGGSVAAPEVLLEAEAVGLAVARTGAHLICGGRGGVMEAACRGARRAGGLTIGLLPGDDRGAANPHVAIAIPTGLGHFRNFLVVQAADGVIALPGAAGTRSEAAMAQTLGKPLATFSAADREWNLPGAVVAASAADAVARVTPAGTPAADLDGGMDRDA